MLAVYFTIALGTLSILYYVSTRRTIHRHGKRLPKPDDTLPIFGNAIRFLQPRDALYEWFVRCQHQFGLSTYQISVPILPQGVVINDPSNLEYVLSNEYLFQKGDFFRKRSWDLFGNGIINADGELWRTHRKAGLQFFSGSSTDTLIEVELPRQFQKTRATLQEAATSCKLTDLEAVLFDLTTRTMGLMAYGINIDATSDFATAFDYASGKTGDRFQNPVWQFTELINGSKLRAAIREVHRFGKEIVTHAESRYNSEQQKLHHDNTDNSKVQHDEPRGTLIDSLLNKISDRRVVADSALNFLSAARDTTAQALTWNVYCLMRNPHIIPRIRAEISQALSNKENLTTADLQSTHLPYLHAVFNESLRLYPPIPFEIKECFKETTLPDGTFLPAGSIVLWCIWSWNRSPEIWGNDHDVEAYIPERWLVDGKFKGKSPHEFPVFNAGPRACLGRKMAEVLSVWILINVVEEFDFIECSHLQDDGVRERPKEQPPLPPRKTKNSLTLPMEGGLPCRVFLRDK